MQERIKKIAAAVFIAGLLIVGIGCGMAFVEYSSFEYGGEYIIGEKYMTTEVFEVKVDTVEGKKVFDTSRYQNGYQVTYDSNIPENSIVYEVSYNSRLFEPEIFYEQYEEDEFSGAIQFLSNRKASGESMFWIEAKDAILADLKEKKIGTYEIGTIERVKVCMNPQMRVYYE